jgi:hypothetical protein
MVTWLKANVHPLDLVYKLANDHSIVLLNGGGFDAPEWSVRVSFANLPDEVYEEIGSAIRAVAKGYFDDSRPPKPNRIGARAHRAFLDLRPPPAALTSRSATRPATSRWS